MTTVRIDALELAEVLRLTPSHQNVMLVGRHGIGKSQIITESFASSGLRVVTFFLGQMSDPGDLIGLMHKDEASGRSEFLPPYWWPHDADPIVLFLDELNRARPEILQAVMDLTLNRTLAGRRLPKDSRVIAAVNEGEAYQLTDMDPALVSRFNVYEFAPTVEDWLVWAQASDVDSRVLSFIQQHPEYLDGTMHSSSSTEILGGDLEKTPDRRAWAKVSQLISGTEELLDLHIKLMAGVVGMPAALAFANSIRNAPTVSAEDLLLRFGRTKSKLGRFTTPDFAALNERVVLRLQQGKFKAAAKKKVLTNFHAYVELLLSMDQSEACAHLAATLEKPQFEAASLLVLGDSKILASLVDFVGGIALD